MPGGAPMIAPETGRRRTLRHRLAKAGSAPRQPKAASPPPRATALGRRPGLLRREARFAQSRCRPAFERLRKRPSRTGREQTRTRFPRVKDYFQDCPPIGMRRVKPGHHRAEERESEPAPLSSPPSCPRAPRGARRGRSSSGRTCTSPGSSGSSPGGSPRPIQKSRPASTISVTIGCLKRPESASACFDASASAAARRRGRRSPCGRARRCRRTGRSASTGSTLCQNTSSSLS